MAKRSLSGTNGAWTSSTSSTAKTKAGVCALLVDCGVALASDPVLGVAVVGNLRRVLSSDHDSPEIVF